MTLWVIDAQGHLAGGVFSSELLCAAEQATVSSLIETALPTVSPETELDRGSQAHDGLARARSIAALNAASERLLAVTDR